MSQTKIVGASPPLTLNEALVAARFAKGERDRQVVRDSVILGLRAFLPPGETSADHARRLAADLREPAGRPGMYAAALAVARNLSRAQRPLSADRIEKILNGTSRTQTKRPGCNCQTFQPQTPFPRSGHSGLVT